MTASTTRSYFGKAADGSYGFYRSDVHTAAQIPAGAVAVDEATRLKLIAAQGDDGEIGADADGNPVIVPYTAAQAATRAAMAAKVQLSALDAFLPRALEDMWTATGFDTTKLPPVQQARLKQKIALRAQIAPST